MTEIDARRLRWWIGNHRELSKLRDRIFACHQVADIMIGYYQYFKANSQEPYVWAWKWIDREVEIGAAARELLRIAESAVPLGRRFEAIRDAATDLLKALTFVEIGASARPLDDPEGEARMRSIRSAAGRVMGLISELETEVLATALSIAEAVEPA
jgi:hypothetical protein